MVFRNLHLVRAIGCFACSDVFICLYKIHPDCQPDRELKASEIPGTINCSVVLLPLSFLSWF